MVVYSLASVLDSERSSLSNDSIKKIYFPFFSLREHTVSCVRIDAMWHARHCIVYCATLFTLISLLCFSWAKYKNIFIVVCHRTKPNANDSNENNPIFINIFSMRTNGFLSFSLPFLPILFSSKFLHHFWLIRNDDVYKDQENDDDIFGSCANRVAFCAVFRFRFRIYFIFLFTVFSHVKRHHYHINVKRLESYFGNRFHRVT